ncbi:MAG: ornithine carbamoyltransferase [Desulfurococcales archaeon ex4484_217_2]|nr:MAG: ornithine carbamoyltransferase [Desulfurococcales archaeon ex4484_217_2]
MVFLKSTISDLAGKDLITTQEWTIEELRAAIELARELKRLYYYKGPKGIPNYLEKKTFIMLFYAPSTRTRAAFETAMTLLGGHAQYVEARMTRVKEGEALKDLAKMYEIFGNGVGIRILDKAIDYKYGEGHKVIREFAKYARVPVINMADDQEHPTQALGDIMTIEEKLGNVKGKKYVIMWAYAPIIRGYCSINAEMLIATRFGMDVIVAHPPGFELPEKYVEWAKQNAKESGGSIEFVNDYREALHGAHVVFPRNWCSRKLAELGATAFGKEELEMYKKYRDWRLKVEDLDLMDKQGIITHVLPVLRDFEADDVVMDSPKSVIYEQAENNLFAKAAVLVLTMGGLV